MLSVGIIRENTTMQGLQGIPPSVVGVMGEGRNKSSRVMQGARPNLPSPLDRCWWEAGGNYCYFQSWQLCLKASPGSKSLLTEGWLQVAVTCAVGAGRGPSGSQALCEETHGCPVPMLSADSSVSAFPCDAARGPGVQQAG